MKAPAETVRLPTALKPLGKVAGLPVNVTLLLIVSGRLGVAPLKVVLGTCQRVLLASVRSAPTVTAIVPVEPVTFPARTVTEPLAAALLLKTTPAALVISRSWKRPWVAAALVKLTVWALVPFRTVLWVPLAGKFSELPLTWLKLPPTSSVPADSPLTLELVLVTEKLPATMRLSVALCITSVPLVTLTPPVTRTVRPPGLKLPAETVRLPVTRRLSEAVIVPLTARFGIEPATVFAVPDMVTVPVVPMMLPMVLRLPVTSTANVPMSMVAPGSASRSPTDVTFAVSTGPFGANVVPGTNTLSPAAGTPLGAQLATLNQSVEMPSQRLVMPAGVESPAKVTNVGDTPVACACTASVPNCDPTVHRVNARPCALVDVEVDESEPPLTTSTHVTVCPPIGLPNASVTRTTSESESCVPTVAI